MTTLAVNRYSRPENAGHPVRDPNIREHYVYRALNASDELLYVGCSLNPPKRVVEHKSTSDWYGQATRYKLSGPYNYETARELERQAIATERPLYNYTPERRAWKMAHDSYIDAAAPLLRAIHGLGFWPSVEAAIERADLISAYPGNRAPICFTDSTVSEAKERIAEDLAYLQARAVTA